MRYLVLPVAAGGCSAPFLCLETCAIASAAPLSRCALEFVHPAGGEPVAARALDDPDGTAAGRHRFFRSNA